MTKRIFFVIFLLAGSFVAVSATQAQSVSVSGSMAKGRVTRGGASRGSVVMSIPGGLHVNTNRPGSEYAIPTTVRISGAGFKVNGVTYPRGRSRKFGFSETALNVYDGRISFPFSITVPRNFTGRTIRVRAVVRYQACTDEVCYPPTSKTVNITARVE